MIGHMKNISWRSTVVICAQVPEVDVEDGQDHREGGAEDHEHDGPHGEESQVQADVLEDEQEHREDSELDRAPE